MATITTISASVGARRIVPTVAIPYPVGNPTLSAADEHDMRKEMVERAVNALATAITETTSFE